MWCKGLKIDATLTLEEYQPYYGNTYEVGLVQILECSRMKAVYEDWRGKGSRRSYVCRASCVGVARQARIAPLEIHRLVLRYGHEPPFAVAA
jgi:hypothetical protein